MCVGYTGGSTAELRSRWFDETTDEFAECKCAKNPALVALSLPLPRSPVCVLIMPFVFADKKVFLQDEGFCRCTSPFVGVPPDCGYTCGPARYRSRAGGCMDEECCVDCPPGTDCDLQDNTKETMKIAPGHWRVSNSSIDIRPCLHNPEACEGGAVAGELGIHYCKLHHRGPYCSLCVEDYYPEGDSCKSCDDVSPSGGIYALLVLAVLVIGLFAFYKKSTRFRQLTSKLNSHSMIVKVIGDLFVVVVVPNTPFLS
jgi:hypothetical protein